MNAVSLYAKASADFADKLAESQALLRRAAQDYTPLTQASSLGAEDVVITHLLAETGITASVFVLDTGKLHAQTVALIGRIETRYQRRIDIYRPDAQAAEAFEREFGEKAMYDSLALRKQCCGIRKMEPLARWTAGDVWHYIGEQGIPYNPLHDEFFPSIGCAPCTRAVTLGEDIRSGRWWWEQESAKECGLHVQEAAPSSSLPSIIPIQEVAP